MNSRLRSERGASPASVIILITSLLMLMELVVMGGRVAAAHGDIGGAAREAARQASVAQSASSVDHIADVTALANLDTTGRNCTQSTIDADHSQFDHGGEVTVEVSCQVDLTDFSILKVPWGKRTFTAEATEIVDTYRSIG